MPLINALILVGVNFVGEMTRILDLLIITGMMSNHSKDYGYALDAIR